MLSRQEFFSQATEYNNKHTISIQNELLWRPHVDECDRPMPSFEVLTRPVLYRDRTHIYFQDAYTLYLLVLRFGTVHYTTHTNNSAKFGSIIS